MPTPVVLVIAGGPNVGAAVAKKFADNGYKVAIAARSVSEGIQSNRYLHVKADLSNPDTVPQIFREVKKNHGIPNIVVYNGLASVRASYSLYI
jgi:NAD(P)-dependent dehydrogenase (short-subunit alcohol dehydrogenase family)